MTKPRPKSLTCWTALKHCKPSNWFRPRNWSPFPIQPLHVIATIHIQLLTGDVIAFRGKESGCLGDFLRSGKASEGNFRLDLRCDLFRQRIHLPGGDLQLEWRESDNCVYMTGPATEVFSGELVDV